jgi:hypothetical protein
MKKQLWCSIYTRWPILRSHVQTSRTFGKLINMNLSWIVTNLWRIARDHYSQTCGGKYIDLVANLSRIVSTTIHEPVVEGRTYVVNLQQSYVNRSRMHIATLSWMAWTIVCDLVFHEPIAKPRDQIAKMFLQRTVSWKEPTDVHPFHRELTRERGRQQFHVNDAKLENKAFLGKSTQF